MISHVIHEQDVHVTCAEKKTVDDTFRPTETIVVDRTVKIETER